MKMDKLNYEGVKLSARERRIFFSGLGLGLFISMPFVIVVMVINI